MHEDFTINFIQIGFNLHHHHHDDDHLDSHLIMMIILIITSMISIIIIMIQVLYEYGTNRWLVVGLKVIFDLSISRSFKGARFEHTCSVSTQ